MIGKAVCDALCVYVFYQSVIRCALFRPRRVNPSLRSWCDHKLVKSYLSLKIYKLEK